MLKFILSRDKTFQGKVVNFIAAYFAILIWNFFIISVLKVFFLSSYNQIFEVPFSVQFFYACIMAPLGEEILFRYFPIQAVKATKKEELYIPVIMMTSVVFGLMHGGPQNILIQGVTGFILSVLYIKNNYSLLSIMLLHALWNLTLLTKIINL